MEIKKSTKIPPKYYCELCDYFTCYLKDYNKHLLTKKHMEKNGNIKEMIKILICKNCKKEFKTNAGLWKHKQKCESPLINPIMTEENGPTDKQLIIMLIKENLELRKQQTDIKELILEIVKNGTHTTNNNTHTNSHNKAFNLNFFLNETCKNAMNITDFVDSIKLQLSDLMDIGEIGYL